MILQILKQVENVLEQVLFASRWLLAPFYLGLACALGILLVKFLQEFWHLLLTCLSSSYSDVLVRTLTLVDFALAGSLLVIVIFSGYENFVSRLDHGEHKDWPEWMGTIDFSALKLKLLSSIVAISAIQLLKDFMDIKKLADRDLGWAVGIHLVFVVSSVLLALSDRISSHTESHAAPPVPKVPLEPEAHTGGGPTAKAPVPSTTNTAVAAKATPKR